MKNLVIFGSGGREHALAYKCSLSQKIEKVFLVPGNPGASMYPKIESVGINLNEPKELKDFLEKNNLNFAIIGPENLIADGLGEKLEELGMFVLAPGKVLAQLESSKAYAKEFMLKHDIPTSQFKCLDSLNSIEEFTRSFSSAPVVKADELHGGKGVVVCESFDQAKEVCKKFLSDETSKVKAKKIVLEERLHGKEVSVFALSDGKSFEVLGYACDHKRLLEGDLGPNTGGMGCYVPQNWPSLKTRKFIEEQIVKKTFDGIKKQNMTYKGFLFFGLMIDENDSSCPAKVIEYNVRMGDPETQTLMPMIKSDLMEYFYACKDKILGDLPSIKFNNGSCVHVVLASEGYPGTEGKEIQLGKEINISCELISPESLVYFAGVKASSEKLLNSGGRVLGVSSMGENLSQARSRAYNLIKKIHFDGAIFRGDIGGK